MAAALLERSFPALLAHVSEVVGWVSELASQAGIAAERLMRLELAVEEALANLCNHAYAGTSGDMVVRVRSDANRFLVELEDAGPPFDPLAAPEPDVTQKLENRRPGGLGIFLMRRAVDELRYRRQGDRNVLSMVVKRTR
jgi:serine/threonine-protein kinase RsbW